MEKEKNMEKLVGKGMVEKERKTCTFGNHTTAFLLEMKEGGKSK